MMFGTLVFLSKKRDAKGGHTLRVMHHKLRIKMYKDSSAGISFIVLSSKCLALESFFGFTTTKNYQEK